MAARTPDYLEFLLTVNYRSSNFWVGADHPTRWWKRCLKDSDCCDVSSGQFVYEPVPIGVDSNPEPFLGLDSVVMIKSIVGELSE
jgi:hypothetical protein